MKLSFKLFALLSIISKLVIAHITCIPHHTGENNWPSNTVYAIKEANKLGFNFINLTLELSQDNEPFAYHGFKLEQFTNGRGDPESFTIGQLQSYDAAYFFDKDSNYPLRGKIITIPTLNEILKSTNTRIILDFKSKNNLKLVNSIVELINKTPNSKFNWNRIIFYSTDENAINLLKKLHPSAEVFLNRSTTFKILLTGNISKDIIEEVKSTNWIGFELYRDLNICENFTLGQNCVNVKQLMWNKDIINKIRKLNPKMKIVFFDIESKSNYKIAESLGVYGIYSNSPLSTCITNN